MTLKTCLYLLPTWESTYSLKNVGEFCGLISTKYRILLVLSSPPIDKPPFNHVIIPDHIELQVLEERMTNIQNSKQARFEENKKTYHQISLIFEMVFYIIKSSKDKRNIDFFENSYKEYRNTFLKKEKLTSNSDFEPDVDDFL